MTGDKLSVVLPLYNEEGCIERLLADIEKKVDSPLEFILVDDGSTDNTLSMVKGYKPNKPENRKKILILSRNFGHQQALMAGLYSISETSGTVVVMDADYQDDPKDIPLLLKKLDEGFDCVYAVRKSKPKGVILKLLSLMFYKLLTRIASFYIPPNVGTFSVFNRRVLEGILEFSETDIYFPGLRAYVGCRQVGIPVQRRERIHGKSNVGVSGLINLSIVAMINFSGIPMRVVFVSGLLLTLICFILGFAFFLLKIAGIIYIPGVTTILVLMMGMFGMQIMLTGILGEYIGRLLKESKKRPRWIVKELIEE